MNRIAYFGTWGRPGHLFRAIRGTFSQQDINNICKIDSPVYHEAIEANGYHYLHYKNFLGYAIPYSADDKRGGCITVVFVENATSANDIIKTLEQHPDLQRRFRKRMPQPSEL